MRKNPNRNYQTQLALTDPFQTSKVQMLQRQLSQCICRVVPPLYWQVSMSNLHIGILLWCADNSEGENSTRSFAVFTELRNTAPWETVFSLKPKAFMDIVKSRLV